MLPALARAMRSGCALEIGELEDRVRMSDPMEQPALRKTHVAEGDEPEIQELGSAFLLQLGIHLKACSKWEAPNGLRPRIFFSCRVPNLPMGPS